MLMRKSNDSGRIPAALAVQSHAEIDPMVLAVFIMRTGAANCQLK
jgi:hypothetical protein